jgi:hypothetical protein
MLIQQTFSIARPILIFVFCGWCALAAAQSVSPDLRQFNEERLSRTRRAMWVLGGWAVANMAIGGIGIGRSSGVTRSFHTMNVGWNVVNLGLAGSGLWTAYHTDPGAFDLWQTIEAQQRLQRILLFNAGLDIGYVATGAWMLERAKTDAGRADRWKGFGRSLLLQGAFLFVFDVGAFLYHRQIDQQLKPHLSPPQIGMGAEGIRLSWTLGR